MKTHHDNTSPLFNEEDYYDEEIAPRVKDILVLCKAKGIPALLTFCYAHIERPGDEEGTASALLATSKIGRPVGGTTNGWAPGNMKDAHYALTIGMKTLHQREL